MKVFALSALLVVGLSSAVPAFAGTPVYSSKASSPAISACSSGCASENVSLNDQAFDGRTQNSKLGSSREGTTSVDVMTATFRAECSKCSS
jgi:hypothetical protein